MSKYQNGKIYKIVSSQTDQCYVGSTIRPLKERFRKHCNIKIQIEHNMSSQQIMKYKDATIMLLENYPCNNKKELETRERFYIETLNCCNQVIPTRTNKEWYVNNKERKTQTSKEWNVNNRERKDKADKERRRYKDSWGGHYRYHNNLLKISLDIFK